MAKRIGPKISKWPTDLLSEFGVPTPREFDRIQGIVDAENERLERRCKEQMVGAERRGARSIASQVAQ
jgi:hypothetical protein